MMKYAAFISARDVELAKLKLNQVVVNKWIEDFELTLPLGKTVITDEELDLKYCPTTGRQFVCLNHK